MWVVITVVGVSLAIAWAAWVAFQPRPVSAQLYGYDVVDDRRVDVTVLINRPDPSIPVQCTVYAQSQDHAIVGEKTVDVAPGTREEARVGISLETERRAVTGVLRTCQTVD